VSVTLTVESAPGVATLTDALASSLVCEHCGQVADNSGALRYHLARLCPVLYPLSEPSGSASPSVESLDGEPEWTEGFRSQVAKRLWERGLKKKAIRFLNCNLCARPGLCSRYPDEHRYFIPQGCEVVFCRECADVARTELLRAYWHVVCNAVLEFAIGSSEEHARLSAVLHSSESGDAERKGAEKKLAELWTNVGALVRRRGVVLWRVNFTLRSDGSEITPERVKKFNACVRAVMKRAVRSPWRKNLRFRGAQSRASGCPVGAETSQPEVSGPVRGNESETARSPQKSFGMLFADEVGFETRGHLPDSERVAHGLNLHCHGLYFGPPLDWERTRDLWIAETAKRFGVESRGFYYKAVKHFAENPGRAIRYALNHMFKYVSKPPAVTPERLASLIAAFNGARRVHSLGLFYGKKPEREKKDCLCPKCKAMGIVSTVGFEGRVFPNGACIPRLERIEDLCARGYVPLRKAGRESVLSMGVSREESWGASP
jgi:hypothetical protein